MKILWMSPHLDSDHPLAKALASRGVGVFVCGNADEASSLLQVHGRTVDLAIVHREGMTGPDDGLGWIERIKTDPAQSDLPILLTADGWGDADFAQHQASPYGCNAYLRWPATEAQLLSVIQSIFPGENLSSEGTQARTAMGISVDPPTAFSPKSVHPSPPPPPTGRISVPPPPPNAGSSSERTTPVLSLSLGDGPSLLMQPVEEIPASQTAESETVDPGSAPFQLEAPDTGSVRQADDAAVDAAVQVDPTFSGTSLDLGALVSEGQTSIKLTTNSHLSPAPIGGDAQAPVSSAQDVVWKAPEGDFSAQLTPVEPAAVQPVADDPSADPEIAAEMPYLFSGASKTPGVSTPAMNASLGFVSPLGDAVVPGGAAQTPDLETLKKYLLLREQDVAVLSNQLKSSQDQVSAIDQMLRMERAKSAELLLMIEEQKRRIDDFDREKAHVEENVASEINDYKFQLKVKNDKVRALEAQVRETTAEIERIKERVRADIRKIRVREKELENRLEILKKDSEALIVGRENKIVELKRRIDLLEFNMDLLQDQYSREKETNSRLRERLARAAQVVRVAGGLLDAQAASALSQAVEEPAEEDSEGEKKAS